MQAEPLPIPPLISTPVSLKSPKGDRSPSVTPPEAWGGGDVAEKVTVRTHTVSRFASRSLVSTSNGLSTRASLSSPGDTFSSLASDGLNLGGRTLELILEVEEMF